ncbi:putative reverse transcriptase [Diachasmimorpha longicaudata entomopoxvirus]|uniref:Putative reverse transcriptase n=1 Tax=Diachasmimorpha longicaudata entomopoxvirus TaxID=109981 RepID=A0A7R5WFW3_9POXV|nr:putative reverse transcriptase [Diachasmimorpha longicaudata entomopoxvirus]AKS26310.1 putative reverse transcriptase [Diachasmimorpha longicaudata entomopoxvirus]
MLTKVGKTNIPEIEMVKVDFKFPEPPETTKKTGFRTIIVPPRIRTRENIAYFNKVFDKPQFAFMRDRTHVFGSYIYDFLKQICLSVKKNKFVIKLDISSAFDSVDLELLKTRLAKYFTKIEIEELLSQYHGAHEAFPSEPLRLYQGFPLSPHLFKFYLLDLLNITDSRAEIFVYVDDIIITAPTKQIVFEVMEQLVSTLHSGGLYINQKKVGFFDLYKNDLIIMNRIIAKNKTGKFDKNSQKLLHYYLKSGHYRGVFAFITSVDLENFKKEHNIETPVDSGLFLPPDDYEGVSKRQHALNLGKRVVQDLQQLKEVLDGLPSGFTSKLNITDDLIPVFQKTITLIQENERLRERVPAFAFIDDVNELQEDDIFAHLRGPGPDPIHDQGDNDEVIDE